MRTTRAPSLLDAVAPVVVLILLIGLTIVIFGTEAADGPLQIALMVSAVFAGLVAFKNGYTDASVRDAVIGGVTSALGAVAVPSTSNARPKSRIFTRPSRARKMFSGLRSRCTIPRWCAA